MKRFILVLLLFSLAAVFSQQAGAQARLRNTSFLEAHAGFAGIGMYGSLYYSKLFNRTLTGKMGASFVYGRHFDIHFRRMYVDMISAMRFSEVRKVMFTSVTGGITLNGDYLSEFPSEKLEKVFYFDYGLLMGLETEFHLTKNIIFMLTGNYRYYIQGRFSNWHYQTGLGLKFIL